MASLLNLVLFLGFSLVKLCGGDGTKLKLICEGQKSEELNCGPKVIHIYTAIYGRTDKTACSCGKPEGQLSNINCLEDRTLTVKGKCGGEKCSPEASNENSDPCSGTYKYLNITYTCVSTDSSPPPPTIQSKFNYTLGDLVFVRERMSWVGALHHCAERGSRLVHILDSCTQRRVEELLAAVIPYWGCMEKVWVGLERCMINPLAPWEWSGGADVGDYKCWISSFPINTCCFHCGQLVQEDQGEKYGWQDACCQDKLPFICQHNSTGAEMCPTSADGSKGQSAAAAIST